MSAVLDFPVKPAARPYLEAFVERADEPEWLRHGRRQALTRFAELGFPTRRSESWRYFDLRGLEGNALAHASNRHPRSPSGGQLDAVCFAAIGDVIRERPEFVRHMIGNSRSHQPLADLNAAFFADGFVIDVPAEITVERPIAIAHPDATETAAQHTRSLINLGPGSRATIVETFAGESGRYWRNDVVTVRLAEGAELTRIVLVEEGAEAIHTALTEVDVGAGAKFSEFVLMLGGNRVRHEANVRLVGEGARCEIDGAYIVTGDDEANIVTAIEHAAPGGQTRELIKGVAAGSGHGAFQGRIVVHEHAQKTDAHQLSRNLLLGRRAVIDTKPELEIYADDVKCSHGASVGDLDETALFYLRARGIPDREARHILIGGFLREATESIGDAVIREHLQQRLAARLAALEEAE